MIFIVFILFISSLAHANQGYKCNSYIVRDRSTDPSCLNLCKQCIVCNNSICTTCLGYRDKCPCKLVTDCDEYDYRSSSALDNINITYIFIIGMTILIFSLYLAWPKVRTLWVKQVYNYKDGRHFDTFQQINPNDAKFYKK